MISLKYSKIQKCAYFILLCFFLLVIISQIVYLFINPNPKELREMSLVKYALDFSKGINPYSLDVLNDKLPHNMGCYGFIVPLICSPFVALARDQYALLICELLTAIMIIISSCITYRILKMYEILSFWSLIGAIFVFLLQLLCGGLSEVYITAFPGQWGVSASLILMYLIVRDDTKGIVRPVIYSLGVVLLFYIKQYFVFVSIPIFFYILLRNKKEAIRFGIIGLILGIGSVLVVKFCFPLYFPLSIARASIDSVMKPYSYAVDQILFLITYKRLLPVVLGMLLAFAMGLYKFINNAKSTMKRQYINVPYELLCIVFLLLPTMYLARNAGQTNEYILQLWMPYICIYGVRCIHYLNKSIGNGKISLVILTVLFSSSLICSTSSLFLCFKNPMSQDEFRTVENWNRAYEILETYSASSNILVSPHLSYYVVCKGLYTDDYGQGEYMTAEAIEELNANKLYSKLFPELEKLLNISVLYNEQVNSCVGNGFYDVVAVKEGSGPHTTDNMNLGKMYDEVEVIDLKTGDQVYKTHFYVRKNLYEK